MPTSIDYIEASIPAESFHRDYVAKRKPVVFKNFLDDADFKAQKWTDPNYLKEKAGQVELTVEPRSKSSKTFGSAEARTKMSLTTFLDTLSEEAYLTTQYESQEGQDEITTLAPPVNFLHSDIPLQPRIMGNLFLQQTNLWIGKSREGTSSGLHHDFADNLYLLLKGKKRFIICEPRFARSLKTNGEIECTHSNGLISYARHPLTPDGLSRRHALELSIEILEDRIASSPADADVAPLEDEKDALTEELMGFMLAEHADEDQGDDLDALDLDNEEGFETSYQKGQDGLVSNLEEDSTSEGEDGETDLTNGDGKIRDAPDSFSQIPPGLLHSHLHLTAQEFDSNDSERKKTLEEVQFEVIDLEEGQMLYLPASYFHEVTSKGEDMHMAFNYWFFPPSTEDFKRPYQHEGFYDKLPKVQQALFREKGYRKRKRDE